MESKVSIILSILTLVMLLLAFKDRIFYSGQKSQKIKEDIDLLKKENEDNKKYTDKCVGAIAEDIKKIKENHLAHIQSDINQINVTLGKMQTALSFIQKEYEE